MDRHGLMTLKTLGLQHVYNPVRQMGRFFSLLMGAIDAFVETPCLLQMLFQILNAIIFVLESQGLGGNVEAVTGGMFMLSHPSVVYNKCRSLLLFYLSCHYCPCPFSFMTTGLVLFISKM